MTRVWFAINRSLRCKSGTSEVHEPARKGKSIPRNSIYARKSSVFCSRCSRSIANLKDVIHGSPRRPDLPLAASSSSPRSIGSSDFVNPLTHDVVLGDSGKELKIAAVGSYGCGVGPLVDTAFVGHGGDGNRHLSSFGEEGSAACSRRRHGDSHSKEIGAVCSFGALACYYCGAELKEWKALEDHHFYNHAVTELEEGESSAKIVEKICQASFSESIGKHLKIERILKVHNMQKTLDRFEEYRESVKTRASKLPKKHARCIADGNELLRFHGTTVSCSLGITGPSSLCSSEDCNVCGIIKHGFTAMREMKGGVGVFTALTGERAFESIEISQENYLVKKVLLVCRVIAGRVHKPLDNIQAVIRQPGFDSLAGKIGLHSNIEELYLLNPRALLPCFVVICNP